MHEMKRIKVSRIEPNILFEQWLKEWKDAAATAGSEKQYHFSKALASLQKYPLPLKSGRDCIILQHFSIKLCAMLERKLLDHRKQEQEVSVTADVETHFEHSKIPSPPQAIPADISPRIQEEIVTTDGSFRQWWNICDYAIMLILYKKAYGAENSGYVTQTELLLELQHFLSCLVQIQDSKESYDSQIRCSINTLSSEGVLNTENNKGFILTKYGQSLAKKSFLTQDIRENLFSLYEKLSPGQSSIKLVDIQKLLSFVRKSDSTLDSSDNVNEAQKSVESSEKCGEVRLDADTFDVVLLIDVQEIPGKKSEPPEHIDEICQHDVLFEVRSLKIGDFLWVARCRRTKKELVLPYIVERKRIDDLSASIIDGRFHEQKFRLKKCGIENVIYVIENYKHARVTISLAALLQASTNSIVQDGFIVKYTKNHRRTMAYLASVSKFLADMYQGQNLTNCPINNTEESRVNSALLMEFEEFNKSSSKIKKRTVEEMFVRQFLQIKGVSVQKAALIVKHYPTPRALVNAIQEAGEEGEKLLANIQGGEKGQQISATNSKLIYELYTKRELM